MTASAWIFPGQGSQYVGMSADLLDSESKARDLATQADTVLGVPLSAIMVTGPEEELRQTRNTQPAIFLHSMMLVSLLGDRRPSMVAGHSLGEYSALVVAGALAFEDGLRLVRLRGELMQRAGDLERGTMAAIVGLKPAAVESLCREASAAGIVQPANFNSPGQIVISGSVEGVRAAMPLAKEQGAKLVKELVVSGAFHSPLMRSAEAGLRKALMETRIRDAAIPVYSNVTAEPVQGSDEIRDLLLRQLTSPVRWEESVLHMKRDGATRFVEIGPGKVLQGLVKRIDGELATAGVEKAGDMPGATGT
jgi:[acyl-carrier-protein] S-malonyltransferase